MKNVGLVSVVIGLCACSTAAPNARIEARHALVEASGKVDAIEQLFRGDVTNGGLWFDDPACAAQFGAGGNIAPPQLHAFAQCLAALNLVASPREDALGDVVVMTYPPGIEIEARVVQEEELGPHLAWIGYESRRAIDAPLPTVTAAVLESMRLTGDPNGPLDPNVASTLDQDARPEHAEYAWLRVCVDDNGAVTLVHAFESTSPQARLAFEAAAKTWTFRPFKRGNTIISICSMARMTYPPGKGPAIETLPLPPSPSRSKKEPLVFVGTRATKMTEGRRISGNKLISPEDHTKATMLQKGVSRVVGTFRVCLDEDGVVESVLPLRSTGFADYDRKLIGNMERWRYAPYRIDDQPTPVCTGVTFIYTQ